MSAVRVGRLGSIAVAAVLLSACFEDESPAGPMARDAGLAQARRDAGLEDTGAPVESDAGVGVDAWVAPGVDAGDIDPVELDAGEVDPIDLDAGDVDPVDIDGAVEDDAGAIEEDAGADAGVDSGPVRTVDFTTQIVPIMLARCAPCHTERSVGSLGFGVDGSNTYASMVGVHSTRAGCETYRVVPGDVEASLLYRKIANVGLTGCGTAMPRGGPTGWLQMPQEEVDLVATWIAEGAYP